MRAIVASVFLAGALMVVHQTNGRAADRLRADTVPIKQRHIDASREESNRSPRSEKDQTIVDGWPLYRNERGQAAFNDAMATLRATDGPAPSPDAFKGCAKLECKLVLPPIDAGGWVAPGRIWISPAEYVLFVHSPRQAGRRGDRRRGNRNMRYFVFHEFHNSSRNTDAFDTIASHRGAVFVPFYMTRQDTDARGRRFVVVTQVAPYDVVSIHATNLGSAGPGIEVAKNARDELEPLQALAGILVATIAKAAAPRLEVVNHRGEEGLAMLEAYERRLEVLSARRTAPTVTLPFAPATVARVASVSGKLEDLLARARTSKQPSITEREIVPPKPRLVWQRTQ